METDDAENTVSVFAQNKEAKEQPGGGVSCAVRIEAI
jgi:hypothetical protein